MAQTIQEMWQAIMAQLSSEKIKVTPYRGTNRFIESLPYTDGAIYFAYDTGAIFMDKAVVENGETVIKRFSMGGASSASNLGFVYTHGDMNANTLVKCDPTVDNIDDPDYFIYRAAFDDDILSFPAVDTLIINSNGWFFRVKEIQGTEDRIVAAIISAGTAGGGAGGGAAEDDLFLEQGTGWGTGYTYIYGQTMPLQMTATATRSDDVEVSIYAYDKQHHSVIVNEIKIEKSGQPFCFDTSILPVSNEITIRISLGTTPEGNGLNATSRMLNAYKPTFTYSNVKVVEMGIAKSPSTVTSSYYTGPMNLGFTVIGDSKDITVTPHLYIDGIEKTNFGLLPFALSNQLQSVNIEKQNHGVHNIELYLTTNLNGVDLKTDSIFYEFAWVDPDSDIPLIWFDSLPDRVVNYDNVIIKYQVYNPVSEKTNTSTLVNLLQEREPIKNSPISISYDKAKWLEWDISSLYKIKGVEDTENNFSISCGVVRRDFSFIVTSVGARDLGLINENALMINLSSAGRSNNEDASIRNNWSYTDINTGHTYNTTFIDFNWFNNGWMDDASGRGAYLSVANGASAIIDFGSIELNSTKSTTIELRFRVRNIQEYSTLVTTVPRYNVEENSNAYTLDEITKFGYTMLYDKDGNPLMNEAQSTKETISDKGVCFKYFNNEHGFCIGTQEAFFKSRAGVANVRYKEDEIINLSFVISGSSDEAQRILYIYLNGILSGAINLTRQSDSEVIDATHFEINSKYCDFDLYKLRVYSTSLSMPEVIHNYLSDMRDIDLYDQNQLTDPRDPTSLMYTKVVEYNDSIKKEYATVTSEDTVDEQAYIDKLTMPYAVIQLIDNISSLNLKTPEGGNLDPDDDRLPYRKDGGNRYAKITFVNPALDEALDKGIITEGFYYEHSPSYEAVGVDINVQGTSSQGYPRRNYKTKFKSATKNAPSGYNSPLDKEGREIYPWGWRYTHGPKAGEKIKKWNMDNEDCKTSKFTWKIDYMESSGSYNTGFANLVGNNIYSKHPLEYYNFKDVNATNYRTSVYGFPVMVFHKHSQQDDLGKYNTKNEADVYTYIGRYNLNLDKSANEFYGFEVEEEHPYAYLDEPITTEEENGSSSTRTHKTIAETAECWELRDNQGTWTSFKYPDDARESKFSTEDATGTLEVIKHFEYRYNIDEDALDICYESGEDATNNAVECYNGTVDLTSQRNKNNFLIDKYSNLEALFTWLDSTDTTKVPQTDTGVALDEAEKARKFDETIKYMTATVEENEGDEKVTNTYIVNKDGELKYKLQKNLAGELILNKDEDGYLLDDTGVKLNDCIATDDYPDTTPPFNVRVSYQTDCAGYRIHKFKDEFNRHLNLEYCVIYFILTELLLCYDSRGKNMMLASWGPQEEGGEYIWFPIFYDVDTQLGLNNIGAVLWDYNADATLNGNFSTANSVLWTNLWAAFRTTIEATYRTLRASRLTETNIEGAYLCDPNVFSSYAMRGVRPIIALGLDEYYKYILPGDNSGYKYREKPWKAVRYSGFIDSDKGAWSTNTGYLYTCQGDRKLSRELLIRNRLNYLDSWWLAGSYVAEAVKQGIMIRANANAPQTSDTYLDSSLVSKEVVGYENVPYPKKYFDAIPNFEITPFLSQYVTVFYDEDPIVPSLKYNGINAVKTNTTPSVENGYRAIYPYSEQLTYIPGGDYVSSLGDLSLKYPSHFTLGTGKRLLDITLGSDVPGYNNGLLGAGEGTFDLNAGVSSANKKTLLQKIILTGISGLRSTLDIRTTEKLREFRALGTHITGVTFADGSPLDTVHLPKSVTGLRLAEAKNLTYILKTAPTVMQEVLNESDQPTGDYEYLDKANYEGLYIEGITDYKDSDTDELNFLTLELINDNLGYDSYHLMDNMIKKRIKTYEIDNNKNKPIALTLTGVKWSPYTHIESNEEPSEGKQYYKITDHGTFVSYRYTKEDYDNFIRLRRNEKLFTYDADLLTREKGTITSLKYLDLFIEDHAEHSGNSIIYRADNSTNYRIPNIQGVIYVNNNGINAIKEADLDKKNGKYALNFPNLTIYAATVTESYIAKFIQEDDLGKEEEFELRRVDKEDFPNSSAPYPDKIPVKQNYDFIGWSLTPDGSEIVITYDEINGLQTTDDFSRKCTFADNKDTIVFYATFVLHKYTMRFYNDDNTLLETIKETFKTTPGISNPIIVPSSSLTNNLDLFETYRWLGWAKKANPSVVVDLATEITPIMDIDFIAVYESTSTSVYDNILDSKYLVYEQVTGGYSISLNKDYSLSGKITLPTQINGTSVVQAGTRMAGFGNETVENTITHIFWADPPKEDNISETRALTTISSNAFKNMPSLVYYEQPDTCRSIGTNAFAQCPKLGSKDATVIKEILNPVTEIGDGLFMGTELVTISLPGHAYEIFSEKPFGGMQATKHIKIGGDGDPCLWGNMVGNQINSNSQIFNGFAFRYGSSKDRSITIYTVDGQTPTELITPEGTYGYFDIDNTINVTIVNAYQQ